MRLKKIIILAFSIATLGGCAKKLDELLVNPNSPDPALANADLYLTYMQQSFASFFDDASNFGGQVSRMNHMAAYTYRNAYGPESFNGQWESGYAGVFKHANALIPIATKEKKFVNVAMAKILKAYTMMTLVDFFGDIPFADANQGSDNTNPTASKGKDVYAEAIKLLDEAIVDLAKPIGAYPGFQDNFFGATNATGVAKWRKTAKLLKLRAYNITRLVDASAASKINALLADGDVAADPGVDFEYKYSAKQTNPNSRHPKYNGNYSATGLAGDYMSIYFMWTLVQEKGTGSSNDPRTRYYFYRQRTNYADLTADNLGCRYGNIPPPAHYTPGMPFCSLAQGYWGRDHGDGSGTPPDGNLKTTIGIYPSGGDFDANQNSSVSLNRGGLGAGIQPIWQSAFTEFLKAECALTIGTTGDPRSLLESGVRKSLDKVIGFPTSIGYAYSATGLTFVPDQARKDAYVAKVLALYDAATDNKQKLDVIMKEWYIASWGNGLDAYNNLRRTLMPLNYQFTLVANPGDFTRSMLYPATYVNLNKSAQQKAGPQVQVFWDTNPPGSIK
jgi:hypothetical protein